MKKLTDDTLFARALAGLARAIRHHRRLFFYPHIVLFILSIYVTLKFFEFDPSRDNLVGSNKRYHQNFLRFEKEFPQQADLVVVAESESPEKNRQFIERLGAKLEAETNLFSGIFYKSDLQMLGAKALLFVSDSDLRELLSQLESFRPFLMQFSRATNLVSLFSIINTQFRTAGRQQSAETESMIDALPALDRIISQANSALNLPGTPPSPGITALFNAGEEADDPMTFNNGRIRIAIAHAPAVGLNNAAVERLRQLVRETRVEVPGINVGLTGEPVLDHDEMVQSEIDTTIASVVALVLCALIFIYGYQETGRPIKATLCLIVGLGYTLAFTFTVIGHLNILTITFTPILIGLAVDFGVHLITRYEEELRKGGSEGDALGKAMVFTGQGIFTGAFTTAGAFVAMGFTNFKGIQEMGYICGGGMLICLVPMMTLLPVLLLRGRQNVMDHAHYGVPRTRQRIENLWLKRPVLVTGITLALCAVAASQLHKLRFDYNLLNMQSRGLPAVNYEEKLIHSAQKSVLFAAVVADSLPEAVRLQSQLTNLSSVASADLGDIPNTLETLTQDQSGKLELIGKVKNALAGINFPPPDIEPAEIPELSRTLYSLYGYLGAALSEIGTNEPALSRQFKSLRMAIESLRKDMLQGGARDLDEHAWKLAAFQQALFNDLRSTFETLQNQDNSEPLRIEDIPKTIRDRFVGVTGKLLLQVYPKKDVWNRANQAEFVQELRTVDPNVTGTPVQLYEYTELLRKSYEEAAMYALAAIALLVFLHFRSLVAVVLALLPVAVGTLWMCGLMVAFDIQFNPANIMTLPLVIGIGVTNGIHILNRFAEEQTPSILARSTGKAVLVSGLTTIAGFGSLILAKHQGIFSLGCVMSIGVSTCMIAGLTFLPALLTLMNRKRAGTRHPDAQSGGVAQGGKEPG